MHSIPHMNIEQTKMFVKRLWQGHKVQLKLKPIADVECKCILAVSTWSKIFTNMWTEHELNILQMLMHCLGITFNSRLAVLFLVFVSIMWDVLCNINLTNTKTNGMTWAVDVRSWWGLFIARCYLWSDGFVWSKVKICYGSLKCWFFDYSGQYCGYLLLDFKYKL